MAPPLLLDLKTIDLNHVVYDIEAIRKINPHRHEMEQITSVVYVANDPPTLVGLKEVTMDEFWVRGHIPGQPIIPRHGDTLNSENPHQAPQSAVARLR